ncbi:hypothetical protein Droror1_Dr00013086 [Drosera rotundifolia]
MEGNNQPDLPKMEMICDPFDQLDLLYLENQLQRSLEQPFSFTEPCFDQFQNTFPEFDPTLMLPYYEDYDPYNVMFPESHMLTYDSFFDQQLPPFPTDQLTFSSWSSSETVDTSMINYDQFQQEKQLTSDIRPLNFVDNCYEDTMTFEATMMGFLHNAAFAGSVLGGSTGNCLLLTGQITDEEGYSRAKTENMKKERGGGGGSGYRMNKVSERLEYEEIQKCFEMPISKAAKKLGVGLTVLKKRCRELDIRRWPHRKIKSIKSLIRNVQDQEAQTGLLQGQLQEKEIHVSLTRLSWAGPCPVSCPLLLNRPLRIRIDH